MIIMVAVMGLVIPKGAKMLDGFQSYINKTKQRQELSKERSLCFLQAKEKTIDILDSTYHISEKGVLTRYEKSDGND
jgi:hypothetical protein